MAPINSISSARLRRLDLLAESLVAAAQIAAATTRKFQPEKPRGRRGSIPTPGRDTPLWSELVLMARPFLRRRGEKAKLARLLGVSRQRLHLLLVSRTAYPDAERALQLLVWLNARRRGLQPG